MRILERRAIAFIAVVALANLAPALHQNSEPGSMPSGDLPPTSVVFVCQNGVAMSVWSALTFNRLAAQRELPARALSRASAATFTSVPLRMRLALAFDGYRIGDYEPHVISAADVQAAERVILIDTELPPSASVPGTAMEETWAGFPPMREKYLESRAALLTRVEGLIARLAANDSD